MATTIIKSIGSGGGRDYATIAAWVAAIPSNLVTADEQWIGELYNDSEFDLGGGSGLTINKTTDATRNIILRCAAGHSFKDHANRLTNPLRYDQSKGVGVKNHGTAILNISCDYVTIQGIQFKDASGSGSNGITQGTTNAPNVLIKDCIFQTPNTTTGQGAIILFNGTAVNCAAVCTGGGTTFISNGGNAKFINCLAFQFGAGSGFGFRGNYDSPLYRNCAAFGFNTNFRSGTSASSNYNASSQASPPGANSIGSLTASSQLENVSSSAAFDGRIKAGSSLINAGVREQTYTNDLDIVGSARSTTTPTIGPWEYASSSTSPVQKDLSVSYTVTGSVQTDLSATFSIGGAVQKDLAASYGITSAIQKDLAASYNIQAPAGVSLNTDPDHVMRNNVGSIWANTEFKLTFYRADTDSFVVNKTVTTNASGLLGVVSDVALTAGVNYDIKIKRTANPADMGLFNATAV